MATISITVPDAAVPRIVAGFEATVRGGKPAGMTDAAFVKSRLAAYVKSVVRAYEMEQAAQQARVDAASAVDSGLNVT